jgi:UDPglucose 6-dehydrogenase
MRICVIGAGYVGLVTGACLADLGHDLTCLDIDESKVVSLNQGVVPFHEPGLQELIEKVREIGRIRFTSDYSEALPQSEVVFVAVDTPSALHGQADLMAVRTVARSLAPHLEPHAVVVNKSTVPIGTGDLVSTLLAGYTRRAVSVVSNPEFLREGTAVKDFRNPDRIVLGSSDYKAAEKVATLYEGLNCPILMTDIRTAEMIKYASNAFLATRISFINEVAAICDHLGADIKDVARGMGCDPRIGTQFLEAGLGWGGSCLPKDVGALIHMAEANGSYPRLLRAVADTNRDQRLLVVQRLRNILGELEGRTVALLGLSFKPDTDDLRNAPSLDLAELLRHEGCHIRAYDPVAMEQTQRRLPFVSVCRDAYDAADGADGVVLVTEWPEFQSLDLVQLRLGMHTPVFIDGRNVFDPEVMRSSGFIYLGIGRGTLPPASDAFRRPASLAGTSFASHPTAPEVAWAPV